MVDTEGSGCLGVVMEFLVLGPLVARDRGRPLAIGAPRTRTVLALLLTPPNTLVSVDRLVDELWPEQPPQQARDLVHGYVSRLRRALRAGSAAGRLVTRRPGYLLQVEEQELDRCRYEQLLATARTAAGAGELDASLVSYRHAAQLWRGAPFADTPATDSIAAAATSLTELRLTGLEEQYDVALRRGGGAELVAELTELVTAHPLRERLVGQLMDALHRAGRTADALDLFRQTRRRLSDQLAIAPGPELQQLHRDILRGQARSTAVHPPAPATVRPAQLPPDLPTFTGRDTELAALLAGRRGAGQPHPAAVYAIDGMAGVGKTALAVRAAHRLAAGFPDGQLFIDLHGGPGGDTPVDPAQALDRMLRALGCAGSQIPHSLAERSALYRSVLAARRILVVLDNAATEDQVQPLLPGTDRCLVLVTSRRRLTGLDGAQPRSLDVLPVSAATCLFTRVAGEQPELGGTPPAAGPPRLVEQVVEQCGRLPLAIRIAAARLRARPGWTLAHLVDRLRDEQTRLSELAAGHRSVTAAFGVSYGQLSSPQRRLFRLLGLHPGTEVDRYAAAALAGVAVPDATRLLEDLVDVHLLQCPQPDRYRFHDLLRAYAASTAADDEPEPARGTALTRLFDHYLDAARLATTVPDHPAGGTAWLDRERANLLAVAARAADDWPEHTVRLSRLLFRYLDSQSHLTDAEQLHQHAHAAATRVGDLPGQADALRFLACVHSRQGRVGPARDLLQQALALYQVTEHRAGRAHTLHCLGLVSLDADRYREALDYCQQALALYREAGDPVNLGRILHALGGIRVRLGQYDQALGHLRQARALHRRAGNRDGHGRAAQGLGEVYRRLGRYERALGLLQEAVTIHRQTGNRACLANTLDSLGCLYRQQCQPDRALDHLHQALDLRRQLGLRPGEAESLNNLGHTVRMAGQADQARSYHAQALSLAERLGARYEQARAHDGLAHTHRSVRRARHHWQQALHIYTELDLPEAAEIRAHLRAAD